MPRAVYVWNDEARSIEIDLALPVVERLSLEALEAYKSVPRRGLEIGGLLLGASRSIAGRKAIQIENYLEVPSEHRSGPSYELSAADQETLAGMRAGHPDAVGMYRTVTHSEKPNLEKDDAELFERHFMRGGVFLVIHPATRTAAFYVPGPDGLAMVHEFPFQAADLPLGTPGEEAPVDLLRGRWQLSKRVRPWVVRVAALALGGILGALSWRLVQPNAAQHHAAVVHRDPVVPHVALNVKREGRVLRLEWDRSSPMVLGANHALLQITDGNHQTNLNLTPAELNDGLLSYWADSDDVTFRLQLFGGGRQTNDSIQAGPASPVPPQPPLPNPASSPNPPRIAKSAPAGKPAVVAESDRVGHPTAEAPRPSPFVPPPKPEPAAMDTPAAAPSHPAAVAAAAPAPARSTEPRIDVTAEPVPPSRLSRVVRHIPLLRRLKKDQPTPVPAEPLREAKPTFSAAQRSDLATDVPIDVRVYVTEAGKVNYAELMESRPATKHRDLANAAVFAARRWDFRPAKLGDDNVPSEVILHFRFKASEPAAQ